MLFRSRLPIYGKAILIKHPHPQHLPRNSTNQSNQIKTVPFHHGCHLTAFSEQLDPYCFSCSNLFHQLKSPPHLSEAKRLHAILVVHGLFQPTCTDKSFGSQLVNIYVNFGCLQDAFVVFSTLPQKTNVAWNAILRGLVDVGQFTEVIEFYHLMLKQGVKPDNYTYPLVLKACSCLYALEEGRRVLETILYNEVHHNMKPNVYVNCALIDMFAKCGSLRDAHRLFEEMPIKDLASWTAMICGIVWNGESLEALSLFRRMRAAGLKPDSVIVATILPVCSRLEAMYLGMALQGCALRCGFENDLYVSNALICMYCKCGNPHEARSLFCYMVCRDTVSWSTLIAGYSQNCLYQESLELYLKMVNIGLQTNAIVVTSILPALGKLKLLKQGKEIHNYILKQGLESDVIVGSALIDMYANCGSIREAAYAFNFMSVKDIMIWNSLIAGYSLVGDTDSAFSTFRRIWKAEQKPNSLTLLSVIPTCTKLGALRQGKEIHCYATKSGLGLLPSVGNSLIDMYSKCGYLEFGLKVLNQITLKNVITYNTMISAYGTHGQGEKGLLFYEQMKSAGIRPNKVTFIALLSACSHAGLVDRGWQLYNSMINDYGIQPDMEHYSCMVDLLGRAGDIDGAYKFITRMPVLPDASALGSLLNACQVHKKLELTELLEEQILQINPEDAGHYVLLSNLCAFSKRWKDMSKVRTMMKDKGLEKKPGSSWIQIGGRIYVFHATSTFYNGATAEIKEALYSLLLEMKEGGILAFLPHVDENLLT